MMVMMTPTLPHQQHRSEFSCINLQTNMLKWGEKRLPTNAFSSANTDNHHHQQTTRDRGYKTFFESLNAAKTMTV